MLDRGKHEIVLKTILRDIYKHPTLQAQLAFKGGTCLYFFHKLPRFSTDLDFSLLASTSQDDFNPEIINPIMEQYLEIREYSDKRFTWFWSGNYERGLQNIKIEINKRPYPDNYTIENFLGISIRTLDMPTMFAHKLCAITDRRQMVNRDLYDTWWLLTKLIPINAEIIQNRMGKSVTEYLAHTINYIQENVDKKHIISGLGEVIDRPQKDWARDHLLTELLAQLEIRRQAESERHD